MSTTTVLPLQPDALYTFHLRRWFAWGEANALDPLIGIQRAHVELYIR